MGKNIKKTIALPIYLAKDHRPLTLFQILFIIITCLTIYTHYIKVTITTQTIKSND